MFALFFSAELQKKIVLHYIVFMGKKKIIDDLVKLRDQLAKMQKEINKIDFSVVPGTLNIWSNGSEKRPYRNLNGKREYLGKDKQVEIRKLARKQYYLSMKKAVDDELKHVSQCIGKLNTCSDVDDVYDALDDSIKHHIEPMKNTSEDDVRKWLKKNSYLKDRRQLSGQNKTLKGEYVKSKSEVIIADRLTYYGVPYVYEVTTAKDAFEEMGRPDFLILNKRTGKEYFWEHLGRMGDPQYATRNQVKMEQFARQGILPGKNLIVSFECGERPLSTEYVDSIIKESLI